jgi:hypothetical protein
VALSSDQQAQIEAILNSVDWSSVPADVRAELEAAALAGVSDAVTGGDVSSAAAINAANQAARDYAVDRSAELVGMKYDGDGNLIENPNAEWAISDTTRDQLREILTQSFEQETPMEDLLSQIDNAGIFSPARARMIARTEVNQAEIGGNIDAWKQMGGDGFYDWMTGPHPCDQCREYAEEGPYTLKEIEDIMDDVHPNCSCGPVPHIEEDEES